MCDDGNPRPQQRENVAAGRAAVDAILMLETNDLGVGEIEKVRRALIAVQILLGDLEAHLGWIIVSFGAVVDRNDEALGAGTERHRRGHRG